MMKQDNRAQEEKKKELALALRANLYRRKKIKNTDVINKNQENNDVDKK